MQILINTKVLAMAGVKTLLLLLLRLAGGLILLLLSGYILADSLHAQAIAAAPDAKIDALEICPADPCPCQDFFKDMSVYYFGEDNVTIDVYRDNAGSILVATYNNVNSGDLLLVDGTTTLNGRLGTYSYFSVTNGAGEYCTTKIFSRCPTVVWPGSLDDQRVLGKTFGDFTVYAHTDANLSACSLADVDQDWHVGGNVIAPTKNTLGTRNNEDVILISNDAARGVITKTGEFGINTTAPGAQLDVQGDAIVDETLDVNGIARMNAPTSSTAPGNGGLIVAGGAGIGENINIGNDANVGNNLDVVQNGRIGNDLAVGRDADIGRNASVGNDLTVANNGAIGNDLSVNRNANVGQDLGVGSNATVGDDLQVGRDAQIQRNLTVADNVTIGQNTGIGNDLSVGQDVAIGDDLLVNGTASVQQTLAVNTATVPTGYRVAVGGNIICEEVLVNLVADWPDYVFAPGYDRPDIRTWAAFIAQHQHLPGLPAAAEVKAKGGFELGETNRLLLEKIEQLTLILIDQQTQLDALTQQLESLKH